MKLLLDTHTFLWFISGNAELSQVAKRTISNPVNESYLSMASIWEMGIKISLGKLTIHGHFDDLLTDLSQNGIKLLPINFPHIALQITLPLIHRDPFDRLIISQAMVEEMLIVSKDTIFDDYLIGKRTDRLWS